MVARPCPHPHNFFEHLSVKAIGAVPPEFAPLVQDPSEVRAGEADHLALLSCAERLELHLDVYPDAGLQMADGSDRLRDVQGERLGIHRWLLLVLCSAAA